MSDVRQPPGDDQTTTAAAPSAARRLSGLQKLLVVLLAVLVVVTAVVIIVLVGRGSADPLPSPVPPPPAATVPDATVEPPSQLTKADPLRISIPAAGVGADIELFTTDMARDSSNPLTGAACLHDGRITCVNPPAHDVAYWLKAGEGDIPFGDQVGHDSNGTVYLVGHASGTQEAIFNDLHLLTPGEVIDVTTANGQIRYYVEEVVVLDKSSWSSSPYANEQVPGRLILGTCNHADGAVIGETGSSTQNVLIVAQTKSLVAPGR